MVIGGLVLLQPDHRRIGCVPHGSEIGLAIPFRLYPNFATGVIGFIDDEENEDGALELALSMFSAQH